MNHQQRLIVDQLTLFLLVAAVATTATVTNDKFHIPIAKPGCNFTCGNIDVPFPFGLGAELKTCYHDDRYILDCNMQQQLTWRNYNLQVFRISLIGNYLMAGNPALGDFQKCSFNQSLDDLRLSPVYISDTASLQWFVLDATQQSLGLANMSSQFHCKTTKNSYSGGSDQLQCFCNDGYIGNPYLSFGCRDICLVNPYHSSCNIKEKTKIKMIVIGICTGIGALLLCIVSFWLFKVMKKRYETKQKERLFIQNGGVLLQQQLMSSTEDVHKVKVFESKELEKATDRFHEDRILGKGGQGTVYKGMLSDGRIVAVKKSKDFDKSNVEQFINEVFILSQINHRNVVKLIGCCLETEFPLLVYECISNGTLFQHIHSPTEDFRLSWGVRLRIACEIAGALSYLHSSASMPIYHRDVKSSNILLDDKYKAKVADFGTSKSISLDQTHLTTVVQGTFGYLDPEYFQSSQFTDKSDVYSFGVVIVELLTSLKPILSTRSEQKSLATYFIQSIDENRLIEILDPQTLEEGCIDKMVEVAQLARRCLNLNGRMRPTMKEVSMELEGIEMSQRITQTKQNEEIQITVEQDFWEETSTFTRSYVDGTSTYSSSLSVKPS